MTKQEKIEILEKEKAYMISHGGDRQAQALDSAIEALRQQPCEDAVSREEVWCMITSGKYPNENDEQFIDRLVEELEKLPSVTPTRKKGKWIECKRPNGLIGFKCSRCGTFYPLPDGLNYCPNCGSFMIAED